MKTGWAQWLMPTIPATWEVEIWRIMVQGQPEQKGYQDLIFNQQVRNGGT
jgi:hypothetical protein